MQLGYSLLLREYVSATEIDYGDCSVFQIVCPACREAIFKAGKYGQDRQYLSHYAASKSDVTDCELRVAAITQSQIAEKNIIGHGQTMEQFFAVSRDFILKWLFAGNAPKIQVQLNWMVARPTYIEYVTIARKVIRSREEHHRILLRTLLGELFDDNQTDFWIKQQSDFSSEFIDHLIAPNSLPLFMMMFSIGIMLNKDFDKGRDVFINGKDKQLRRMIERLDDDTYHAMTTMFLRTFDIMLMTIPYTDILKGDTNDTINRDLLARTIEKTSLSELERAKALSQMISRMATKLKEG